MRIRNLLFAEFVLLALSMYGMAQSEAGQPLVVISYNIRYQNNSDGEDRWSNRQVAVAEALKEADVVGLQEVLSTQLDDLKQTLKQFEFYGVGRDDGQQAGEMVPIGVRTDRLEIKERGTFWLSETPNKAGAKGWDAALPRIASWLRVRQRQSGEEWLIVNTHFDHRGPQARTQSGKLLRSWIAENGKGQTVVLMGDFNARQSDPPLQSMISSDGELAAPPLRVARDVAAMADSGPDSTWNGFKAIVGQQRIDHMLLSGPIEVESFLTLDPRTAAGRFASDHLPIRAQLSQRKNAAAP